MRKFYLLLVGAALICAFFIIPKSNNQHVTPEVAVENHEDEEEGYDGPAERDRLEFEKTKDPALGYVPYDRLMTAIDYTDNVRKSAKTGALLWVERGPIYDSVGPSNGNTRAGNGYTSGRMRAVLVDLLNDPTGNTVLAGGVSGGLWKCTNFLSAVPNWVNVNDYFDNMGLTSICQDPTSPNTMYFATGEATSNADAVLGRGVWKSTNGGTTWTFLPSTLNFIRNFKIICDNAGNVYLAARPTTTPAVQNAGLLRSKNGGTTWEDITPNNITANTVCTDIELSSTGKLHASFGYRGTIVNHVYTSTPATVTTSGWTLGTGIRNSATATSAVRMELACIADTLYAVTVNTANNADSCYKSTDGGATWTLQNPGGYPTGVANGQGWYNLTLAINPDNRSEILVGGLDAYRSTNSGASVTRLTFWVTTAPYVHADHHFMQWSKHGTESRVIIGCDGGIFISRDAGATWLDKNRNLGIKQFYSVSIHPAAGSDYLLAGAQDNGSHQLKNPGLSYSIEVTGGDGAYVHINQQDPQIQFTSYVYNNYRRSTNGGQTWSQVNFANTGSFINPFDYDDAQNIMYGANGTNAFRRWPSANTGTASTNLTTTTLGGGIPSAFKVSPYTPNRVFIGSSNGRLIKLDNANTVTAADIEANVTNIRGAAFSNGNINCINTGTSDQNLVAVFSNYGVSNVWISNDGGTNWTAIDGNLPDMPVRWAVFVPGDNTKLILATEAGIYSTDNINGATTVWTPDPGFPIVRVSMLKVRASDNTIVASAYGRGLFTAVIPTTTQPEIRFVTSTTAVTEESGTTADCRGYKDYTIGVGVINPPAGDATVTYTVQAGNTATQGPDFDFTTNGNFTNPSNQHVFATGVAGSKNITLRIYDDGQVESPETFTIGFAVSGTTNAVAGAARTHVVTIGDNDKAPLVPGNLTATVGSASTNVTQPFRGQFSDSRTQTVFLASELEAAGFTGGSISAISLNVTSKNSTAPYTNFTIKMKNTSTTSLTGGAFEAGAVTVYNPTNYSTVFGVNSFTLSTPFVWDGTSNLLVEFCYDNTAGTATDNVAGTAGIPRAHFERTDGVAGCSIANAGFTFTGGARPDIGFTMAMSGTPIATALNSEKTQYIHANNDVYYYSATGQLIARLRNLSGHNYGCTKITIDRAGTEASRFWNSNAANYLMDKTFQVTPATNNATGRYEITLYYTEAEKAGWEAATGQLWSNIQLVKVPTAIKNVTPSNAQPDGPGSVQVVTPTRGTFGLAHTLTYTFENGFSGFGAGIPGRMTTILTLTGKLDPSNRISLDWTTSAEINSTTFELEKSYNGNDWRRIATVTAAGNKFSPSTYNHMDPELVQVNYYRLRMLHSDGYVLMSDTVLVRLDNLQQQMSVLTNPFDDDIRVRFTRAPTAPVVFTLYDASGKRIRQNRIGGGSYFYAISGQNAVSRAVYILDALVDGKHYTVRVMKK